MALITCPECGKKVSDTAEKCIHCGAPLKTELAAENIEVAETKPAIEYYENLPQAEQDKIYDEYMKVNVECKKHNDLVKALNIVSYVCWGVGAAVFVVWLVMFCMHKFGNYNFPEYMIVIFAVLIVVALIAIVGGGVLNIVFRFLNKKTERLNAEFKAWLRETKNLDWGYNTDVANK